jgi:hypothetical protein
MVKKYDFKKGDIIRRATGKYLYVVTNPKSNRYGDFKVKNIKTTKEYWIKLTDRNTDWVIISEMFPIY